MIIRRYINGKKVDIEVNTAPPQNKPVQTTSNSSTPYIPPQPPPRKGGCGCGRK